MADKLLDFIVNFNSRSYSVVIWKKSFSTTLRYYSVIHLGTLRWQTDLDLNVRQAIMHTYILITEVIDPKLNG